MMDEPNEDQYRCAQCGEIFTKVWTDEEVLAEFREMFPNVTIEEVETLCDTCYEDFQKYRDASRN